MRNEITKKDIERAERELKKAKAQGDSKRYVFWEATLAIYKKNMR